MSIMKACAGVMALGGGSGGGKVSKHGHMAGKFGKNATGGPGVSAPWLKPGAGKTPKINPGSANTPFKAGGAPKGSKKIQPKSK